MSSMSARAPSVHRKVLNYEGMLWIRHSALGTAIFSSTATEHSRLEEKLAFNWVRFGRRNRRYIRRHRRIGNKSPAVDTALTCENSFWDFDRNRVKL